MYNNYNNKMNLNESMKRKLSNVRGCMLGGAAGDALGYPVEFMRLRDIHEKYGPCGIQTLQQAGAPALISDDTQMSLFAANGIIYHIFNNSLRLEDAVWTAYREWLGTQGDTSRMDDPEHPKMWLYNEDRLHARRAPGNTCLYSIKNSPDGGSHLEPINDSKGCGTVMRAAPYGLSVPVHTHIEEDIAAHHKAYIDAALTHGHRFAHECSGTLAVIIQKLAYDELPRTKEDFIRALFTNFYEAQELHELREKTLELVNDSSVSDEEGIRAIGEGWVAEEALFIAIFCAARHPDDFAAAVRAAVNHNGDSDSTGAICGNIMGAWLGAEAVEQAFDLSYLELRDVVDTIACDLFFAVNEELPEPFSKPDPGVLWQLKYIYTDKDKIPLFRTDVSAGVLDPEDPECEAIVNPTDTKLSGSGDLDKAIHQVAGTELEKFCSEHRPLKPGDVISSDHDLGGTFHKYVRIIHAAVPEYQLHNTDELVLCYYKCLCEANGCTSIKIPLLGTDLTGWPAELSLECAWKAVKKYIYEHRDPVDCWPEYHTVEYIYICGSENNMPMIEERVNRKSSLFFKKPPFQNRADMFFWQTMTDFFDDPKYNGINFEEFLKIFLQQFRAFSGHGLKMEDIPWNGSDNDHNMFHSGEWWIKYGLPALHVSYLEKADKVKLPVFCSVPTQFPAEHYKKIYDFILTHNELKILTE